MAGKKGASGRPRKPSALKILHGDFEKDPQRRNKREPMPKPGKPIRPRHLRGEARKAWDRLAELLSEMKVSTKADRDGMEQYACLYERWRITLKDVQTNGSVIDGRRNPADVAMMEYSRQLHKLLTEFGLTPSSRTRVQIEQETNSKSDLERKYLS